MTLKDLAKLAGVSISTVSKALNDSPEIGEKTKTKINELATLYNYEPNNVALTLKTGKTNTIGVIVPSVQNNFFAKVIVGIEEVLNAANYNIIISITHESLQKEASIVKTLSNGVVDGFLIAVAEETQVAQNTEHFVLANNKGKHIVFFDRVVKDLDYNKVIVDDKAIVNQAVNTLINKGKSNIALVSAIYNLSVGQSRKQGYLSGIETHQNPIIIEATVEDLENNIRATLNQQKVDAIIALDEDASLMALKVANDKGLQIPSEMAIIGFAPSKFAEYLKPKLSTINQHGKDIGRQAAKLLLDKLNSNSLTNQRVIINSTIDHRATS